MMTSITGYPTRHGFAVSARTQGITSGRKGSTALATKSTLPATGHRWPLAAVVTVRDFVDKVANSSPARLALIVFALVILAFTLALSLPAAARDGHATAFHDALFTAVSAVCVTGLTTVSTALHWSFFGQLVILIGIFVGGLGILTLA